MDQITKHLVTDFLRDNELNETKESDDFEKFVNYTVMSREYNKTFEIDTIYTGTGNPSIDGLGIIVNGHLVESTDEVDDLVSKNGHLEITYVFIQSKTSDSFDSGDMGKFFFGVRDFFSDKPSLVRTEEIQRFSQISSYLFTKAAAFRLNPACKLYYVTTGKWVDDQNLKAVFETAKKDLESLSLFSEVLIYPWGATDVGTAYRQTKNAITADFVFERKVILPELEGVEEAYYGYIPFKEFKKMLLDENSNLLNVFEDNVRDFQGLENPVNKNIAATLGSDNADLFSVLNNGITIVASTLRPVGSRFHISDYQIVNGCQTSNVLYSYKDDPKIDNLSIPLKLIITKNEDIKNKITLATNSQTAIKAEQLTALTTFQRQLEHYYQTIDGDGKLFYERRSKQYDTDPSVIKARIITIPFQIKSFASMFLDIPHRVTSYFGTIVNRLSTEDATIFKDGHQYIWYYTAGLAYYRLEKLFRSGRIDSKYRKIKYFLIMGYRILSNKENPTAKFMSKKFSEEYCSPIIADLNDEQRHEDLFLQVVAYVDKTNININDKDLIKQATLTDAMLMQFKQATL